MTRELEAYEVERFRQMGRHLDLMWNVGKVQFSHSHVGICGMYDAWAVQHCAYWAIHLSAPNEAWR